MGDTGENIYSATVSEMRLKMGRRSRRDAEQASESETADEDEQDDDDDDDEHGGGGLLDDMLNESKSLARESTGDGESSSSPGMRSEEKSP